MVTNWFGMSWSKGSFVCWMLMLEPIVKGDSLGKAHLNWDLLFFCPTFLLSYLSFILLGGLM